MIKNTEEDQGDYQGSNQAQTDPQRSEALNQDTTDIKTKLSLSQGPIYEKCYQKVKQNTPYIRKELVKKLRKEIETDTYQIKLDCLAEKLLPLVV